MKWKEYHLNLIVAILVFIVASPLITLRHEFTLLVNFSLVMGVINFILFIILYREDRRNEKSESSDNNR